MKSIISPFIHFFHVLKWKQENKKTRKLFTNKKSQRIKFNISDKNNECFLFTSI